MIILMVILTGISTWLEWQFVHTKGVIGDAIRWFYANKTRRLLASVALSIALGRFFGAAGLIALIGGVLSTFIIQPLYAAEQAGVFDLVKDGYAEHRAEMIRRSQQVVRASRATGKVAALPFRGIGWIADQIDPQNRKAS